MTLTKDLYIGAGVILFFVVLVSGNLWIVRETKEAVMPVERAVFPAAAVPVSPPLSRGQKAVIDPDHDPLAPEVKEPAPEEAAAAVPREVPRHYEDPSDQVILLQ